MSSEPIQEISQSNEVENQILSLDDSSLVNIEEQKQSEQPILLQTDNNESIPLSDQAENFDEIEEKSLVIPINEEEIKENSLLIQSDLNIRNIEIQEPSQTEETNVSEQSKQFDPILEENIDDDKLQNLEKEVSCNDIENRADENDSEQIVDQNNSEKEADQKDILFFKTQEQQEMREEQTYFEENKILSDEKLCYYEQKPSDTMNEIIPKDEQQFFNDNSSIQTLQILQNDENITKILNIQEEEIEYQKHQNLEETQVKLINDELDQKENIEKFEENHNCIEPDIIEQNSQIYKLDQEEHKLEQNISEIKKIQHEHQILENHTEEKIEKNIEIEIKTDSSLIKENFSEQQEHQEIDLKMNQAKYELHDLFDFILQQNQVQFKEIVEQNFLLFQNNEKFEQEMKFLSKCKKKVDNINNRLTKNFKILFEDIEVIKQIGSDAIEMKTDVVIGCALYEKLIQDDQVLEKEKIIVPSFFQKPKENIFTILKNILKENSEESIIKFTEAVNKYEEELMKIELFETQLKYLVKCQKKVDLINQRFLKEFLLIFEQKDDLLLKINEDNELSDKIAIGCALYAKISQDSRIKEADKIIIPVLLKTSPKFQKYNEFLQLKLMNEDDQENLIDIQEYLKQIYIIHNEQESQQQKILKNIEEIQDCIEIFDDDQQLEIKNLLFYASQELTIDQFFKQDFFNEQIQSNLQNKDQNEIHIQVQQEEQKEQIIQTEEEERLRNLKLLEQQRKIEIENLIKIQKEQGEQLKLNIKNQQISKFDQDPLKFLQAVIDQPQDYLEIDIEKLIKQKYFDSLIFDAQEAFETTFLKLTSCMRLNLKQQENVELTQKKLQESINILYLQKGCTEVAQVLEKYCQIRIPQLKFLKHVSKEDQIKEDFQEVSLMLPKLENKLFIIDEFSTIFDDWNVEAELNQIKDNLKQKNFIDGEKLMYVLFDFVKRRNKFLEILNQLYQINSQCKITQITLFTYMILHSDQQLKVLLFIACAQFMAIPLITFNPWNIDPITGIPQRIVFPEMVYIFEKNQAILQVKLKQDFAIVSSQQQNKIQNCSVLINKLFGKDFSLHSLSTINEGTIEIQFDYNNGSTDYLVIADAHGQIDIETLKLLIPIFDCFIIHVSTGIGWMKNLEQDIEKLNFEKKLKKQILIIAHEEKTDSNFQFKEIKNFSILNTSYLKDLQEIQYQNLLKEFYNRLNQYYSIDVQSYKQDSNQRIESKKNYLQMLQQFGQDSIDDHLHAINILEQLVELIKRQDDLKSLDFLPMLHHVKQKCDYENKLMKDQEITNEQRQKIRIDQKSNQYNMDMTRSSDVVNLYKQVIKSHIPMKISPSLTQIIKGYIEMVHKPLLERRGKLREKVFQDQSLDKDQKCLLEEQLKITNEEFDKKWFSQELITREIYYLSQLSKEKGQNEMYFKDYSNQLIQTAQPFELIDGDTLQFVSDIYEKIFSKDDKEDLLVVSVMGPQSSGKSLLMNFIFGTQFLSSAGRCTKGVYASIIKYKCRKTGKNKKILILDTEGIQSAEARDPQFDKQIVYYILCVSHVILMCNKGEMNAQMADIVKLVADAVVKTRESFIQSPDIYIIFNMVAERNEQAQLECVSKLQDDLVGINNLKDTTNKVLKITKDNIYPLTFAFNMENFGPQKNYVNKPSPFFTNQIIPLRERILSKFNDIQNEKTTRYSINEWFLFATKFWSFTSTFKNLIDFQTLQQLREDEKVKVKIDQLIQKYYEEQWKTQTRENIENILKTLFLKNQGGNSISFDKLYRDIQSELTQIYEDLSQEINDEYQKFCQEQSISIELRDKRASQLPRKKEYFKNQCMIFCNEKISNFTKEKSKDVGDAVIQDMTYQYLHEKESYTEQQAAEKFEEAWLSAQQNVQKVLKNQKEIIQQVFQLVRQDFQSSLEFRKNNVQEELTFLEVFRNQENVSEYCKVIIQKIQESKIGSAIFYIGDKKIPNFQKILEFQDQKRFYMNYLPENMFRIETNYTYYQWRKVFDEFLDIELFIQDIVDALNQNFFVEIYKGFFKTQIYNYLEWNCWKVQDTIKKFRQDCQKMGINFSGDYKIFIPTVDYQKKQIEENQEIKKNQIIEQNIIEQIQNLKLFTGQNTIVNPYKAKGEYYPYNQYEFKYFKLKGKYGKQLLDIEDYKKNIDYKINEPHAVSLIQENEKVIFSDEIIRICNHDCLKYFYFLQNPAKNKTFHFQNIEAQKFFFNTLDWQKIFQEIEIEVIKNFRKDQQYHGQGVDYYIQKLLKQDKESLEIQKEFCDVKQKMTRGIVTGVKQIIQKIDDELENYCMKISQNGIYWINTVAQTFTNRLAELIEIIKQIQPLNMLEDRKETEKNIFIAKLTANDAKMDQAIGKKVAQEVSKLFYNEAFEFSKNQFKQIMEKEKEKFQKVSFIMEIEKECEKISDELEVNPGQILTDETKQIIEKLVQFYKDPKKFLEHSFQYKFEDNLKEFIQQCQQSFKDQFLKKINTVKSYFNEFIIDLRDKKADRNASMLFYWHESSKKSKEEERNFKNFQKLALTQYFKDVLKMQWQLDKILEFQDKDICLVRNQDIILPHQSDLKTELNYLTIQKINSLIKKTDEISQLHKFFEQIILTLNEFLVFENEEELINEGGMLEIKHEIVEDDQIHENPQEIVEKKQGGVKVISKQDLIDEYQQDFKQFFMGCYEYCPLCRRQCDLDHNEIDDLSTLKHECSQGHQMQGFGGSKTFGDDFAVLSTCNELRDNDVIVYKGDEIKWVKFKIEKFPNWSFETSSLNIKENRLKNVKIWNLVGQSLCKLYYDFDGININFQKAENKPQVKAPYIHYILMLDDSGSMGCSEQQPWNDLMSAFTNFMKLLSSNINLLQTSKISVLIHETTSVICFEEKEPNVNLSSFIKPRWGGNDFNPPLYDARKLCHKNLKDYDKFVLYFMSDGGCGFPHDGVKQLIEDKQIIDKIDFHSVAFGSGADKNILKQIADCFPNGQLSVALNAEALGDSFKKLVPHIYE